MRYILENELIKAEIESFGGELKSLVCKATGQEYMWEADPAFWGKTSPVLFPFIGKLEDASYEYENKRYEIEKHGFARDMEFDVAEREEDIITFFIESNENTLKKFPFSFRLEILYELEDSGITEKWRVINKGSVTMYFSMGGHPAFACPPKNGKKDAGLRRTDCFLKLYEENLQPYTGNEVRSAEIMVPEGLLTGASFPVEVEESLIPVKEHIFDKDALCLEKQGVKALGICDAAGREYVRLEADCPVWGIWSVPDSNAAYICLEPWWGICDSRGYGGTLQERPYTNSAEAGEVWEQSFKITVS
ncbi:MAG: aldose 1-epimerase family protein [Acetatifactor sp.]|nr:aldose 1-epimerase family protein [Acetatifactor sp.]